MSGYQIKELIGRTISHFWTEGYGQIYPTLKQLSAAGLASSRLERGNGTPDRRVYTLTEAGSQELRDWLARPVDSYQPARSELLLKLFFGRHATAQTSVDHVRRHRELLVAMVAQYEAIEVELNADSSPDQSHWLITLRHGLHAARASLAWCDETIARLSTLNEEDPS